MSSPWVVASVLALIVPVGLLPLVRFWGNQPEYADRLLIILVAVGLAWQRRHIPVVEQGRYCFLGGVWVVVGGIFLALGVFLQVQVAPRPLLLWWLYGSWAAMLSGVLLGLGGTVGLRRLAFPIAFGVLALPIPQRFQLPMQHILQTWTTVAAEAILSFCGVPVDRQGFVLQLPACHLNVVEACSGVRSVTALMALAAFAAYWYGLTWWRSGLVLGLTLPLIAGVNAGRVALSGFLGHLGGPQYIQGAWHEVLGLLTILPACGGVGLLARRWRMSNESGQPVLPAAHTPMAIGASSNDSVFPSSLRFFRGAVLLIVCVCAVAALLGWNQQAEICATAEWERFPLHVDDYRGHNLPIPASIHSLLTPDQILHRLYEDPLGRQWEVWLLFWSSPALVKGYHHPDVCWPNRGYQCVEQRTVMVPVSSGVQLPVTERLFARQQQRYWVWYWTQQGRRVWTAADERHAQLLGDSHAWVWQRLWYRRAPDIQARLTVWIGIPSGSQAALLCQPSYEFIQRLARQLYEFCPWATPMSTPLLLAS